MSVKSGFFNGVNHDRKYNATQLATLFDGIIRDGVLQHVGKTLMVREAKDMRVNVDTGKAWFNSTWTHNDTLLPLTISPSELLLDRIDAVILDIDKRESVRNNDIVVVKGIPSSTPQKPELIKTKDHWQYPLAYIHVKAEIQEIKQADITNCIGTSECPFVTAPLEKMDVDDLIAKWASQWEVFYNKETSDIKRTEEAWKQQWNELYNSLKDKLSENAEINLKLEIDKLKGIRLSKTLRQGQTTLVAENVLITAQDYFDVYTSEYGVSPKKVTAVNGKVTLEFKAQSKDIDVEIIVRKR